MMLKKVTNLVELEMALQAADTKTVELQNSILSSNPLKIKKGLKITAAADAVVILSFSKNDGLILEGDNEVSNLAIQTSSANRAIYIDSLAEDLGTLRLQNLTVTGQISLLTRTPNKKLRVEAENIDIVACDSRACGEQPQKYGVNVYQGAFSIYNYSADPESLITASVSNISIGRKLAPVIGSGIFIAGFNETGGQVLVEKLTTKGIYTNGMIPFGQPNLITGGIFILNGAKALEIHCLAEVVTFGTNDMVLDVWGEVVRWQLDAPIISYGASGIGFVNFGKVEQFIANDKIETFGLGARGFNQYDGSLKEARFDSILTHADGSIGIQISKPVEKIEVKKTIETAGSIGQTLVKGVIMPLAADAISVKTGGSVDELRVGELVTNGDNVVSYHVDGGVVTAFSFEKVTATGKNSKEVLIENGGQSSKKED